MTRLLVTGAGGFVGSRVLAALEESRFEVVATGRRPLVGIDVPFEAADLLDQSSRRSLIQRVRPSHLLHLAWIAEPGVYWRSPANLEWAAASIDLFHAFRQAGGTRLVALGSCAEYAWGGDRLVEDVTPCHPATLYGAAKDATRRLLEAFARETGVSAAWARLFFLYGPGERGGRLVSDAIAALRAGTAFPTSHGRQRRDFLHVDDAAGAIRAVLESTVTGPVNIASGQAVPVRTILDTLAAEIGNGECLLYGQRALAASEPAVIEGDPTRLHADVGFQPKFDLVSGLRGTVSKTLAR